jgi:predicted nuclease of predicted toxin-antitoxin system
VTFLADNQLPTALARFLASRGVECQHVLDVELEALKAGDRIVEVR